MKQQTNRDLTDHASLRCIKAVEDVGQLVDTVDEAAMIMFTIGCRLMLLASNIMHDEKVGGFDRLTATQRAMVVCSTAAHVMIQGDGPSEKDVTPAVDAAMKKVKAMLIQTMV